jgi:SAM-dependent methyltransferase
VADRDWYEWHEQYEDPDSHLVQRLATVQSRIRAALDEAPPGPLRAISVVAGQGRDLILVLATHPRGADVTARLVELDPRNTAVARALASGQPPPSSVDIVTGDASFVEAYAGLIPADLVLLCGLFGNITDDDIRATISAARGLTRTGGTVIWTRGRGEPDRVDWVASVFEENDFERVFVSAPGPRYGVGEHRHTGPVLPLPPGSMFTFVGRHELKARGLR